MHENQPQFASRAIALGASLAFAASVYAADPALNSLGQAGGLVIPYAFVLPEGVAEAQYNDYLDPRFGNRATGAQMYWGALGVLPYVELSGGMANYPADVAAPFSGADHFLFRHLMADVKLQVPQLFDYQPAIAFGMTDVGGQTHYFRSKYGVLSEGIGAATLTLGYGQGDRLDGVFGGAQLSLWNTGLSLLAEDDAKTPYMGVRYQSPQFSWLAGLSVIGTVTRAMRSTDGVTPRTSFSIGLQIPLGKRFDAGPATHDVSVDEVAGASGEASADEASIGSQTNGSAPAIVTQVPPVSTYAWAGYDDASSGAKNLAATPKPDLPAVSDPSDPSALHTIVTQLVASGLERVRVGISGDDLIVEYENHRYNQNEADALGIVFGVASANAPSRIERIHAVIKKANQALGEVSVDRDAYVRFINGGDSYEAAATLAMQTRLSYDDAAVAWYGDEKKHGLTRIQIQPVTSYLFGTEYGVFDASLGVNVAAYVPLWKGAELYGSYIAPFYNTTNMEAGHVFGAYRLRNGLSSADLAQSFWIAPSVLNVAAIGRFDFDYVGVEDETTMFVPGRADLVRLRLAYLHEDPGHEGLPDEKNAELTYRWVQPAWNLWVEAGVAKFVGGGAGPELTLTRWFDDVAVSLQAEHSGQGSFVGATISFPLTLRQGMKPGITQVDGTDQFSLDFRTRVHGTNYLEPNAAENLSFPYDTQQVLLNQGRFSADYFATQLNRMRDAYERYARPEADAVKRASNASTSGSLVDATSKRSVCANFFQALDNGQVQAPAGCK